MRTKLFAILSGVAIAASMLALVPDDAVASSRGAGLRGGAGGVKTSKAFAQVGVTAASTANTWFSYPNYVGCRSPGLGGWTPGLGAAWLTTCGQPFGGSLLH
jgi:hypothetical protein